MIKVILHIAYISKLQMLPVLASGMMFRKDWSRESPALIIDMAIIEDKSGTIPI
jgi:hypothetical protein